MYSWRHPPPYGKFEQTSGSDRARDSATTVRIRSIKLRISSGEHSPKVLSLSVKTQGGFPCDCLQAFSIDEM